MARPSRLASELMAAYARRDWAALQVLLHPEAVIAARAADLVPLGPEDVVAAVRDAHRDPVYDVQIEAVVDIGERVCIISGRVRHRTPMGGFADHEQHWINVFQDGLLWRACAYPSIRAARKAFRRSGYTLGLDRPATEPERRAGPPRSASSSGRTPDAGPGYQQ